MRIIIPLTPEPQRRGKIVRVGGFSRLAKTDKQQTAETHLIALLSQHRPALPLDGALKLTVKMVFPIAASKSRKQKELLEGAQHAKTPDASNCLKHLEDCMQRVGFFHNDCQIAKHDLSKIYDDGHGPRWEVTLEELSCRI